MSKLTYLLRLGIPEMMTPNSVLEYVKAEPSRPFHLHTASGRTFDIHHPELIKVFNGNVLVFSPDSETSEIPEGYESVSLMLTESISHLEAPVLVSQASRESTGRK